MDFSAPEHDLPFISTDQMREVDRAMIEDYGILVMQMMENAGRCLADLARKRFLPATPEDAASWFWWGRVATGARDWLPARRLHSWGTRLQVRL